MSGTDAGVSSASTILSLTANDWVSLIMKNSADNDDPTVEAGNVTVEKK